MASSKLKAFWNHPAGLKTIVAASGLIWSRYGMVIKPKNWNLCSVNFAMSVTGFYQLYRKLRHDASSERETAAVKE